MKIISTNYCDLFQVRIRYRLLFVSLLVSEDAEIIQLRRYSRRAVTIEQRASLSFGAQPVGTSITVGYNDSNF
jgi:hypothetical protein